MNTIRPHSLYIHIPFCIRKCIYCDFFSVSYNEPAAYAYTDALCKELLIKKRFAHGLKTVYFGGGTPSLLPHECFTEIFRCLKDNFDFSSSREITVEANPGTLDGSKIDLLLSLGVNRLSIGVQSFNNEELGFLGRIHTAEEAMHSAELIKKAGVKNFSLDLMYAIPGQTGDTWKTSLSKAIELSPTHISAYELTPEQNTPLYKLIKADQASLANRRMVASSGRIRMPGEDLILEMYDQAIDHLTRNGYDHYEISNFSIPGFRCSHNLNYWDRGEYLGAGAGAHSFIGGTRSKTVSDVARYIEAVNKGIIPESESNRLMPEEALREFVFLGLRKREGIDLSNLPSMASDDRRGHVSLLDAARGLTDERFLEIKNGHLRFTGRGLAIANTITVKLFENLGL